MPINIKSYLLVHILPLGEGETTEQTRDCLGPWVQFSSNPFAC